MNMFLHELRAYRKSTIIWICSLIAVAAMYLLLYPSIMQDAEGFKKLLATYPAPVREALGISLDAISSILGFYTMVMAFVTLLGAIQAMNIGLSVVSKEMSGRTADFLLVKPVSRSSILTAKLLASLTLFLVTDVVFFIVSSLIVNMVKKADYSSKLFIMINLILLFIQLIFFAIGFLISVILPKIRTVLPLSLGIVFGLYLIGSVLVTGANDAARFISPFRYFSIPYILKNASYEAPYLITSAVIVVLSIVASYLIYIKKDIHAVS